MFSHFSQPLQRTNWKGSRKQTNREKWSCRVPSVHTTGYFLQPSSCGGQSTLAWRAFVHGEGDRSSSSTRGGAWASSPPPQQLQGLWPVTAQPGVCASAKLGIAEWERVGCLLPQKTGDVPHSTALPTCPASPGMQLLFSIWLKLITDPPVLVTLPQLHPSKAWAKLYESSTVLYFFLESRFSTTTFPFSSWVMVNIGFNHCIKC